MTLNPPKIRRVIIIVLCLLLTILWLGFIFGNSLKDGKSSSEQSKQVHEIVNQVTTAVGIEKPVTEKAVRKMAHFTEFSVLGVLLCLDAVVFGLVPFRKKHRLDFLWMLGAVPLSFLFANVDEYLQTFSEGRAWQFTDILLDTAGATQGTIAFLGVFLLLRLAFTRKKSST